MPSSSPALPLKILQTTWIYQAEPILQGPHAQIVTSCHQLVGSHSETQICVPKATEARGSDGPYCCDTAS